MQFKLQFRLWHIFALTAAVGVLCAFPAVRFVVAGTSLVVFLGYAVTYGFLFICRAALALIATIVGRIAGHVNQSEAEQFD